MKVYIVLNRADPFPLGVYDNLAAANEHREALGRLMTIVKEHSVWQTFKEKPAPPGWDEVGTDCPND